MTICGAQVLDEQIDSEKLVTQFRERLKTRLEELGLGKSGFAQLFEEMDVSGRGELTTSDLSMVLFKLNFHVSKVMASIIRTTLGAGAADGRYMENNYCVNL